MPFKKYIITCCLIFVVFTAHAAPAQDSTLYYKFKSIADSVGKLQAPDQRTAVFKLQVKDSQLSEVELETTVATATAALHKAFLEAGLQVNIHPRLLPAAELGTQLFAVVSLSVANNRREPRHAAEMMTQMIMGTPVQLLKKERGYYLVRTPDNYISWVDAGALALMDAAQFDDWKKTEKLVYLSDYGFSYSAPNTNSLRVSDLVKGNIFKVLAKEKGFYKIVYPDQRIAYVSVKDAAAYNTWVARPNPNAAQILNTAKTLMGVPYLWGGTSIKGVDCSGFTKTSFFLNGIILPRDASQQALVGAAVDIYEADTVNLAKCFKNLQAGDLLFFAAAKGKTADPRVTHTAIYIGNGQFIQSAGMVCISSLDPKAADYEEFHARTLVSARRMLNSIGTPEITRIDQHHLYAPGQ